LIFGIAGVKLIDGGSGGTIGFSFLVIFTVGDCFNKLFINMVDFGLVMVVLTLEVLTLTSAVKVLTTEGFNKEDKGGIVFKGGFFNREAFKRLTEALLTLGFVSFFNPAFSMVTLMEPFDLVVTKEFISSDFTDFSDFTDISAFSDFTDFSDITDLSMDRTDNFC